MLHGKVQAFAAAVATYHVAPSSFEFGITAQSAPLWCWAVLFCITMQMFVSAGLELLRCMHANVRMIRFRIRHRGIRVKMCEFLLTLEVCEQISRRAQFEAVTKLHKAIEWHRTPQRGEGTERNHRVRSAHRGLVCTVGGVLKPGMLVHACVV